MSDNVGEEGREPVRAPVAGRYDGLMQGALLGFRRWGGSTFEALSVRNFRIFYIGQGASLTGSWMRRTALGWLVFLLTGSYELLGLVMGLTMLPLFLLAPLAGSIADRVDKRKMIIATQLGAAACSALLAVLVATDNAQVWQVMVLAFLGGVAFAFEIPSRQAFVAELVGKDRLMNAIALNSALVNGARVIGPAVAGVLMGLVGVAACFAIDAITYLIVTGTLMSLKLPRFLKSREPIDRIAHLIGGLHEVRRNRPVRLVLILLFFTACFGWSFITLLPAIAQEELHLGETQYGFLMAAFGVGAVVSALIVASQKGGGCARRQLFVGIWTMMVGLFIFSAVRGFVLPMGAMVLAGGGAVMFVSTGNTVVQMAVADDIRGRIMGIWALTFGGSMPLGAWLSGQSAALIDPFSTIALFAVIVSVASVVIFPHFPAALALNGQSTCGDGRAKPPVPAKEEVRAA
ncbi:MAG: MFS transporter [Sumerlaeia bacterium]